jgi:tetratricopeptide (TPR) repeat protein
MNRRVLIVALALIASQAAAQRHKIGEINTETEEGKFLQSIGTEEDPARKVQLMEAFVGKYGKHEAAGWVWSQLQPAYSKAANFDKALDAGEKLLALDPMDIDAAYANLKASEGKKDSALILKWAVASSDIARKAAQQPKGADQEDDDYKRAVDFAKQVDTYSEYALYATALTATDPKSVLQLADTLEQRNPNSQYVGQILGKYAWAARESKSMPAAIAFGERALSRNQMHEDLLLAMADYHINQPKADGQKVVLYSTKLVEHIGAKPKPEGVSDADWEKRKNTLIGVGHWMAGTTYGNEKKYAQADKSLRAALPYIKDNEQMLAGALFHLALANYTMGKGKSAQMMNDAKNFMQQCAAIKSPFQGQAQKNLAVMRKETGGK